jgi:hypothetical protein
MTHIEIILSLGLVIVLLQTIYLSDQWKKQHALSRESLIISRLNHELVVKDRTDYLTAKEAYDKGYKAGKESC